MKQRYLIVAVSYLLILVGFSLYVQRPLRIKADPSDVSVEFSNPYEWVVKIKGVEVFRSLSERSCAEPIDCQGAIMAYADSILIEAKAFKQQVVIDTARSEIEDVILIPNNFDFSHSK